MAGKRRPALIGASNFTHGQLALLPSSQIGLMALAEVLEDSRTGGFDSVEVHSDDTLWPASAVVGGRGAGSGPARDRLGGTSRP